MDPRWADKAPAVGGFRIGQYDSANNLDELNLLLKVVLCCFCLPCCLCLGALTTDTDTLPLRLCWCSAAIPPVCCHQPLCKPTSCGAATFAAAALLAHRLLTRYCLQSVMIRRTKSEVEIQLPAKLRSTVAVDLPAATLKTLKKLFAEAGGASESASSPSILQLRQLDTYSNLCQSNNCVRHLCYNLSDPLLTELTEHLLFNLSSLFTYSHTHYQLYLCLLL